MRGTDARGRSSPGKPRADVRSVRVPMRDGVRLAVDVILPAGAIDPVPTVLTATRYWRSFRLRLPSPPGRAPLGPRSALADELVARGMAAVIADVRGTGASEGVWRAPWTADEVDDLRDLADWIVAQPWSDGRIAATGISYEGSTAMLAASTGHPALRAVAARSFEVELFPDIVAPGGVLNRGFLQVWSDSAARLDRDRVPPLFGLAGRIAVRGVRRADDDPRGTELARIVAARPDPGVMRALEGVLGEDSHYGDEPERLADLGVGARFDALRAAAVPTQVWGGWMDGTTADSALRVFAALPSVQEAWIGAWSHTGEHGSSPFAEGRAPTPPLAEQWQALIGFLAANLDRTADVTATQRDASAQPAIAPAPAAAERAIHYFTMGEERWHTTPIWPPAGTVPSELHATADGRLAAAATVIAATRRIRLDRRASTGRGNRWHTQLARPVRYGDRTRAHRRLASWSTDPLAAPMRVIGHPELRLWIRPETPHLTVFAYLELVDDRGAVRYLTEALLDARYRGTPDGAPVIRSGSIRPLVPGEPAELRLRFLPTAVVVPAGWRLRVALAGSDRDTFGIPEGPDELQILLGPEHPTRLSVPIAPEA